LLHAWNFDGTLQSSSGAEQTGRIWLREALHLLSEKLGLTEDEAYAKISEDIERVLGGDGRDKQGWAKEDIIMASGMRADQFDDLARTVHGEYLSCSAVRSSSVRAERYNLYKRARHTIQESLRVIEFQRLCEAAGNGDDCEATMDKLGQLMNASHASLKDDYDCTVASVDTLQELCLECGSLGSRQTGRKATGLDSRAR
jgi:galactokinase